MNRLIKILGLSWLTALFLFNTTHAQSILVVPNKADKNEIIPTLDSLAKYGSQVYVLVPDRVLQQFTSVQDLLPNSKAILLPNSSFYKSFLQEKGNSTDVYLIDDYGVRLAKNSGLNITSDFHQLAETNLAKNISKQNSLNPSYYLNKDVYAVYSRQHQEVRYYNKDKKYAYEPNADFKLERQMAKILGVDEKAIATAKYLEDYLTVVGASLCPNEDINILVTYKPEFFTDPNTSQYAVALVQFDANNNFTKVYKIPYSNFQDNRNTFHLYKDSLLVIEDMNYKNKGLKYHVFAKDGTNFKAQNDLKLEANDIFTEHHKVNVLHQAYLSYPYFTNLYDSKVYNIVTGEQKEILTKEDYNKKIQELAKLKPEEFNPKYYSITNVLYHANKKTLFVLYQLAGKSYIKTFGDDGKEKIINVEEVFPTAKGKLVGYDLQAGTNMLIQNFSVDGYRYSKTIPLDYLAFL